GPASTGPWTSSSTRAMRLSVVTSASPCYRRYDDGILLEPVNSLRILAEHLALRGLGEIRGGSFKGFDGIRDGGAMREIRSNHHIVLSEKLDRLFQPEVVGKGNHESLPPELLRGQDRELSVRPLCSPRRARSCKLRLRLVH